MVSAQPTQSIWNNRFEKDFIFMRKSIYVHEGVLEVLVGFESVTLRFLQRVCGRDEREEQLHKVSSSFLDRIFS